MKGLVAHDPFSTKSGRDGVDLTCVMACCKNCCGAMVIMDCVFSIGPTADAMVADDTEFTADMRSLSLDCFSVTIEFPQRRSERNVRVRSRLATTTNKKGPETACLVTRQSEQHRDRISSWANSDGPLVGAVGKEDGGADHKPSTKRIWTRVFS